MEIVRKLENDPEKLENDPENWKTILKIGQIILQTIKKLENHYET